MKQPYGELGWIFALGKANRGDFSDHYLIISYYIRKLWKSLSRRVWINFIKRRLN